MKSLDRVTVISHERWDDIWRRNQWLASELLRQELVREIVFIDPPVLGRRARESAPVPGVRVFRPELHLPKRLGGFRAASRSLARAGLLDSDVLWINEPVLGALLLGAHVPAVYDVTDDWRHATLPPRIIRRIIRAERRLAARARTVVCSDELKRLWHQRYSVTAAVVHNGVDVAGWTDVEARDMDGARPRIGYVGTLHEDRLDIDLIKAVALTPGVGSVQLLGPNALSARSRGLLAALPNTTLHGPVEGTSVPSWMAGFDVLICPHLVTDFTLSLDAIKSYEYLASGLPVVATPSSGFQLISHPRVHIADRQSFVAAVLEATHRTSDRPSIADLEEMSWAARAREFAHELRAAR